ncbi:hypothetical protein JM49_12260 [Pseudomonas chlororaphis subsp. aurantiaca]|nr:hypothetical protein JM49_12260 [Pseudomonas chlororaphis subsp. aurantiaca]
MMPSDNPLLASLVLSVLALPAQAEGLDLSYPAPALTEATAAPAAEPEPSKFQFKAPITLEHTCSGPQCNYETDPSQRHEPETVNRWSVGFN